jgi:hypothetical protein
MRLASDFDLPVSVALCAAASSFARGQDTCIAHAATIEGIVPPHLSIFGIDPAEVGAEVGGTIAYDAATAGTPRSAGTSYEFDRLFITLQIGRQGTFPADPGVPRGAGVAFVSDGRVDISDPLRLFEFLFLGAAEPRCHDAVDADDEGEVGITNGVYVLERLFRGGPEIPAPRPDREVDPTADGLACGLAGACI